MTSVIVFEEGVDHDHREYRAVSGHHQAAGRTPGQAIDALSAQMSEVVEAATIIVRRLSADRFFGTEQRRRLEELMGRWRFARDSGKGLDPAERAELEGLIDSELRGSTERAVEIEHDLAS